MPYTFNLITNVGTLLHSQFARKYPQMLCLSQIYEKSVDYRNALRDKMRQGHRIILDNGAHEGFDVDLNDYAIVAKDLEPSVIVLTDLVGRSSKDSRDRSLQFVTLMEGPGGLPSKTEYMYTPQGRCRSEVLDEYAWAIENLDPKRFIIGLGQGYLQWCHGPGDENSEITRLPMVQSVMALPGAAACRFHLLGARWEATPMVGSVYASYPNLIGVDTIKPVTCAEAGLRYPNRPSNRSIERMSMTVVDEELLRENVVRFCHQYWCSLADMEE